jgi:hypothetical protein
MGSEVVPPRVGQLRTGDLVAVYGDALRTLTYVDVMVLPGDLGAPVVARVELGDLPSGRSVHRALVCPGCLRCCRLLLARAGILRCKGCLRDRTPHQRGRTLAGWRRRGGRDGDLLLRLLAHPHRRITAAKVDQARALVASVVAADWARLGRIREDLAAIEVCMDATP